MKIGFDISQTGSQKAGCGYFAYSLIQNLAKIDRSNEYILYPTFGDVYWDEDWAENVVTIQQDNFRLGRGHKTYADLQQYWRKPNVSFDEHLGVPDILQANNFFCPLGLNHPRLVYLLYDLGFLINPEWMTEANRINCFEGVYRASVVSDMIIAISDYTKNHFLNLFPHYPKERITTIYPSSRFEQEKYELTEGTVKDLESRKFWLAVATIEPRKNYLRLVEAYARYRQERSLDFPLVIVGGKGWMMDNFTQKIKQLGVEEHVIFLGYVDDPTLLWLYRHCFAFIYPSLFEGFGLPVLEAMSQGAAVIASRTTSIPEIVGEVGILIDPNSVEDIIEAMVSISAPDYPMEQLKQASFKRSQAFSWLASAKQVLEVYRHTMQLPYYDRPGRKVVV